MGRRGDSAAGGGPRASPRAGQPRRPGSTTFMTLGRTKCALRRSVSLRRASSAMREATARDATGPPSTMGRHSSLTIVSGSNPYQMSRLGGGAIHTTRIPSRRARRRRSSSSSAPTWSTTPPARRRAPSAARRRSGRPRRRPPSPPPPNRPPTGGGGADGGGAVAPVLPHPPGVASPVLPAASDPATAWSARSSTAHPPVCVRSSRVATDARRSPAPAAPP